MRKTLLFTALLAVLNGCATSQSGQTGQLKAESDATHSINQVSAPFASTYVIPKSQPTLIRKAIILTGTGEELHGKDILLADGKVVEIGANLALADGVVTVNGEGKWVTPGIIDVHSHMGVYPSPGISSHSD